MGPLNHPTSQFEGVLQGGEDEQFVASVGSSCLPLRTTGIARTVVATLNFSGSGRCLFTLHPYHSRVELVIHAVEFVVYSLDEIHHISLLVLQTSELFEV